MDVRTIAQWRHNQHFSDRWVTIIISLPLGPGGGGVHPYMGYIGTCRGIGYGFWRFSIQHPVKRKTNDLSKLKYYKSKVKKILERDKKRSTRSVILIFMFLFYNITRQIRQNAIHRNPGQLLLPLLWNICFQVVFSYSIQPNVVDDCSCTKMPWLFYLFEFENKVIAGNKNVLKRFTMFMMACH